jgi:DNA-binding MarR family transcriptional regulator
MIVCGMHDRRDRAANLLGATALALTDLALGSATRAAGVSSSGAAALVSVSASAGISVTELGRRVGLTQSAAARMVDALEADGLLERRPSEFSSRMVGVHPTAAGRQLAERLLAARGDPLREVLTVLADDEQELLSGLLVKVLAGVYEQVGNSQYLCRLCDRAACQSQASCPVGDAERRDRPGSRPALPTSEKGSEHG